MPTLGAPVRVALRAVLFVTVILGAMLITGAIEPVDLLGPGGRSQGHEVLEEDFGADKVPMQDAFDGQYLYVTARLLPDLDAITGSIEESDFRLPRILLPLLASPAGAGDPLVLALQAWDILGVGLLTWAIADLLERYGFPPGWAMAAPVACALALILTTSEPLAFGLGMAGLAVADRGRLLPAGLLLALGVLTRESTITIAAAAAAVVWLEQRRPVAAVGLGVAAAAPYLGWWAYVRSITEPSKVPLEPLGILHIAGEWPPNLLAAAVGIALMVVAAVSWWDTPPFRWVAVGFLAWLPIYEAVAFRIVGIPRLAIPAIALGIAGLVRWRTERREAEHAPAVAG
jgi:hypothetical protein